MGVKLITDKEEIDALYDFIKSMDLNYPQYDEWCNKCYRELQLGYKKAIGIVKNDNGSPIIIGSIIFQQHKQDPSMIEMKNVRVAERYRKKGVFKRLIMAVEEYSKQENYKKIIVDAHSDYDIVLKALKSRGYVIEGIENLYSKNAIDIMLTKDLSEKSKLVTSIDGVLIKIMEKSKLMIEKLTGFVFKI